MIPYYISNIAASSKTNLLQYNKTFIKFKSQNIIFNKTGVINDPLDQPTVPAGSACRLILKYWDGQTDGHSV